MGQILKSRYDANEIAKNLDFTYSETREIENLSTLLEYSLKPSSKDLIHSGGTVRERSTPSMNVDIDPILAFIKSSGKFVHAGSTLGPVSIANGGAQNRLDTLEVRYKETTYDSQQRAYKDPATGYVSYQDFDTKTRYEMEAQIIQGTEGAGVAPNHTVGWIKLAEILVEAGETTSILDADIKNCTAGKDGETTATWTAETDATFRLESLSDIKTKLRAKHKEDGDHADDVIQDQHIDWGTGANQVSAVDVPIADAGGRITATEVENTIQEIVGAGRTVETVKQNQDDIDSLEVAVSDVETDLYSKHESDGDHKDNVIDDTHIDFGTGAGQVSAVDVPIADAGTRYTATQIEAALQEINPLTTIGDLILKGTVPERLAAGLLDTYLKGQGAGAKPIYEKLALRDTGVKIGNNQRNTVGEQIISGIGYRPSVVLFSATMILDVREEVSFGYDNGTEHMCITMNEALTQAKVITTHSIHLAMSAEGTIAGYISSMSTDGFTITWIKPAGDAGAKYIYLCLP